MYRALEFHSTACSCLCPALIQMLTFLQVMSTGTRIPAGFLSPSPNTSKFPCNYEAIMLITAGGKACPYLPTVPLHCWGTGQAWEELISLYLVTLAVLGFIIAPAQTPSVNSLCWCVSHLAWGLRAHWGWERLSVTWGAGSAQGLQFGGKERILKQTKMDEGLLWFGISY